MPLTNNSIFPQAEGLSDGSWGLERSGNPRFAREIKTTLKGSQKYRANGSATLSGCWNFNTRSGGIASLNPRLPSGDPSGWQKPRQQFSIQPLSYENFFHS
jgi:hypothetical protein